MLEEKVRRERWENCPACGYHNGEWETRCEKCGRRLSALRATSQAGSANTPSPLARENESGRDRKRTATPARAPAFPEQLRKELQTRVEQFRSRQWNRSLSLPFAESEPAGKIVSFPAPAPEEHENPSEKPARPAREIRPHPISSGAAPQPALNFAPSPSPVRNWSVLPVAPFRLRMIGLAKDIGLIGTVVVAFLLPVRLVAGPVALNLTLLAGLGCGSGLIALLYGLLFLWWIGATPGMKSAGLRLVNFDGMPAQRRQRLWRLGGAIVSAGSFLIGFLWAAVDEEKLYWHDHISKTFLTTANR